MSISEKSVENILTDDAINATPNPRYIKPITNIFSFLRETVLTRALRHSADGKDLNFQGRYFL